VAVLLQVKVEVLIFLQAMQPMQLVVVFQCRLEKVAPLQVVALIFQLVQVQLLRRVVYPCLQGSLQVVRGLVVLLRFALDHLKLMLLVNLKFKLELQMLAEVDQFC
jgi:hypothetical protein